MDKNFLDIKSPQEYFAEQIKKASKKLKIKLNSEIEFYLVTLLCDFIEPSKIFNILNEDQNPFDTPFVFLLKKAYESSSLEYQINLFKLIGDTSLYISGYFQDFFNKKTFDIEYYITIGSHCYHKVSQLVKNSDDSSKKVNLFKILSNNFVQYVDLLAEISDDTANKDNKDILTLYDRWNRTNSERLRKILTDLGITPVKVPYKKAQ